MYENCDVDDEIPHSITHCSICQKLYKCADVNGIFVPLILKCAHTCCESCIREFIENEGFVLCKICGMKSLPTSTVDRMFHNLRENFPLAEQVINKIVDWEKRKFGVDESQIGFAAARIPDTSPAESSKCFCEECVICLPQVRCQECGSLLCDQCFERIHTSRTLKSHHKILLSITDKLRQSENFNEAEQNLKNAETLNKAKELYEKSLTKLARVENSLKMLLDENFLSEAKKSNLNFRELNRQLLDYFCFAQNTITLKSQTTLLQLRNVENSLEESSRNIEKDLNNLQTNLNSVMHDTLSIIKGNKPYVDIEKLVEKCEKYLNYPDTISITDPEPPENPIKFPKKWLEMFNEECDYNFGKGGQVCLINSLDSLPLLADNQDLNLRSELSIESFSNGEVILADSYVRCGISDKSSFSSIENSVEKLSCTSQKRPSNNSADSSDRNSASTSSTMNCSSRVNNYVYNNTTNSGCERRSCPKSNSRLVFPERAFKKQSKSQKEVPLRTRKLQQINFKEGRRWRNVQISHVENPSQFYVHLKYAEGELARYQKMFTHASEFPMVAFEKLTKDQIYLALCSDNNWYRVRVVEIRTNYQDINLSYIIVQQVDIGKMEQIHLSNLRQMDGIQKSVQLERPQAITCCLFDCYPMDKATWCQTAIETFKNCILNSSRMEMFIHKVTQRRLEVDLLCFQDKLQISVRDFLVSSHRATYCSISQPVLPITTPKDHKFYVDKDFSKNEWVDIEVTHISSPNKFYVKRISSQHNSKAFEELMTRLDKYFKDPGNYRTHKIVNFVPGLTVAAQYKKDNTWYRASIINLEHRKKICVRYVDFGNEEWLSSSRVRSLPEEFIRITVQATQCCLNDVRPTQNQWSTTETEFFSDLVANKSLKMVIQKQMNDIMFVALFENTDNSNVKCINEELVEKGYAQGIGANAFLKPLTNLKKQKEGSNRNRISKKDVASISGNTSSDVDDEESIEQSETSSRKKHDASPSNIKYQVKVCNFINPNLLYVSLINRQASIFRLINNMTNFYRDEKNNKDTIFQSVMEDTKCAVYVEGDKKWYRGKVVKLIDSQIVQVFLSDVAIDEIVSLENLRSLPTEFMNEIDGVTRCSLANVETKREWPDDVCQALKTQLENCKETYIVYKERIDKLLSVELWVKNVICKGPLDPLIDQWISINNLLMNENEIDNKTQYVDSFEEYKPPSEETLKTFEKANGVQNCTDHVVKWLESSVTEARIKGIKYSSLIEAPTSNRRVLSDTTIDEDVVDEFIDSVSVMEENNDWLPPLPLEGKMQFVGMPTYVDLEFNIYVQITGQHNGILDIISNGLDSRYQNSQPLPSDMHWQPDEICVAWYFLDKKWYRGRVKEVNKKTGKVLVEYVDFGNVEALDPSNLRKNVSLKHIPIQCYKFPIRSDCVSTSGDGLWPTAVLEFVHVTIVEKICEIQLRKEQNEDFYRIEQLIIPQKLDLFDLLYQLNHAVCTSTTKEDKSIHNIKKKSRKQAVTVSVRDVMEDKDGVVNDQGKVDAVNNENEVNAVDKTDQDITLQKEDDDDDDADDTSDSSVPAIENISNMKIDTQIHSTVMMHVNLLNKADPSNVPQVIENNELIISNYYIHEDMGVVSVEVTEILSLNEIVVHVLSSETDLSLKENRKLFLALSEELQKDAIKQPCLKPPYAGRICCTTFDDNNWYRAQIIGITTNNFIKAPVYYIDYGNVSTVPVSQLRQLKPSWYNIPIQGVKCIIEGLQLPEKVSIVQKLEKKMSKMLLNNEFKALIRKAPTRENQYYIKLMNDDETVPYQSIIDSIDS